MAGHGPDAETFERASDAALKPQYVDNTLAFMFETQLVVRPTEFAMKTRILQHEYFECWQGLKGHFSLVKSTAAAGNGKRTHSTKR
jgi:homogentisate 1,2-dioxygenase